MNSQYMSRTSCGEETWEEIGNMFHQIKSGLKHILKLIRFDVLFYYLRSRVYINKIAVPVVKDLSTLSPVKDSLEQAGVELVEITSESLSMNSTTGQRLIYSDDQRMKTAIDYLEKGYRGVALVSGDEVSGDIWYVSPGNHGSNALHPDLKWLRLECRDSDVYAFDMYLYPGKRGKNLGNMLQNGALHEIRKHGYARVFGYYWAENIPALWVHRTLHWQELQKLKVSRFLGLQYSQGC